MTKITQGNHCAAVFKATGQRCTAYAIMGKRVCSRHGALSTGPRSVEGRQRCATGRFVHGQETTAMRLERSLGSARLALLESVGFGLGIIKGNRTRGRRPDRMGEVYPELQAVYQKTIMNLEKTSP